MVACQTWVLIWWWISTSASVALAKRVYAGQEFAVTADNNEAYRLSSVLALNGHHEGFYDSLEPVRASAREALVSFNLRKNDISKATSDLCNSCRRVLRWRWTKCGDGEDCRDPCNRWRNYFFGVNQFCPIMRDVLHSYGKHVDEHLDMMWNIRKNTDAYEETCADLHMCGSIRNVLVESKLPLASSLRDKLKSLLAVQTNFGKDMSSVRSMCQECMSHASVPLSDEECQVMETLDGHTFCGPPQSCEARETRFYLTSACGLRKDVSEQRVLPLSDLEKLPVKKRFVSPLIVKAAGRVLVPWLHEWAVNTSDQNACGWIGLCGDGPASIAKQLTLEEDLYAHMKELTEYFKQTYPKMRLLPGLRASWTAIQKTSSMAQIMFSMRNLISPGLERNMKSKTSEMMGAMLESGFLSAVPPFIRPVLASCLSSFNNGNPFGPRHFLDVVAKAFAVHWAQGSSHKGDKEALKTMVLTMQGHEDLEATGETEDDGLISVDDMLEKPSMMLAKNAGLDDSLMQTNMNMLQGTSDAAREPTSTLAMAKAGYTTVYTMCVSLAVYAQQNGYIVYCAAWPVVVARLVPTVMEGARTIQNCRRTLRFLLNSTREFMRSEHFRAVLVEAAAPVLTKTLEGDMWEGLVGGAGVWANRTLDLLDFGALNSTFRHPKVKQAVTGSVQEIVRKAKLGIRDLVAVVPMLLKESITNIGGAVFEATVEHSVAMNATSNLFNAVMEKAETEQRNTSQIALDMLSDSKSPMLQLLGNTSAEIVQIFLPGVDLKAVSWLAVLRTPEVQEELKKCIADMKPPLTASGLASQLIGNPKLRETLVQAVLQEMAPGMEGLDESKASEPGMAALVSLSLAGP